MICCNWTLGSLDKIKRVGGGCHSEHSWDIQKQFRVLEVEVGSV